jgi:hypothetical protein
LYFNVELEKIIEEKNTVKNLSNDYENNTDLKIQESKNPEADINQELNSNIQLSKE